MSGQFTDMRGNPDAAVATAMVKIQLGRSWGFLAADSIRYIYFVNGKPALEQEIVQTKLNEAGYDWDTEFTYEDIPEKDGRVWKRCSGCTLYLTKKVPGTSLYEPMLDRHGKQISVSFGDNEARHATVYANGKQVLLSDKDTYKSWSQDMYYWRCVSRVKKYHARNVLRGAMTREEAYEIIPEESVASSGMLPSPDAAITASQAAPAAGPSLRDRILKQPSFLDTDVMEEPGKDAV